MVMLSIDMLSNFYFYFLTALSIYSILFMNLRGEVPLFKKILPLPFETINSKESILILIL